MTGNSIRIVGWVSLASALLAGGAAAQVGPSGFRSSYELVKTDLTVNEPVFLRFSVSNQMAEGAVVDMGFNDNGHGGFRGKVTRPDGQEDEGPKPRLSEGGAIVRPHIAPGESSGVVLLLNKWFDFDIPGRYVLDIQTTQPVVTDSGIRNTYPIEGSVVIDVGPRDPGRLQSVCQELEERALGSDSSAVILSAAEVLANIRDPVAVPYLAKLLQHKGRATAPAVTRALGRIGGEAAVDALISGMGSPDPGTRIMVRQALGTISGRTDDPVLRQKIGDALR